jgi:hypothetical protein
MKSSFKWIKKDQIPAQAARRNLALPLYLFPDFNFCASEFTIEIDSMRQLEYAQLSVWHYFVWHKLDVCSITKFHCKWPQAQAGR